MFQNKVSKIKHTNVEHKKEKKDKEIKKKSKIKNLLRNCAHIYHPETQDDVLIKSQTI